MRRAIIVAMYAALLALGVAPLMGGCADNIASILDDASDRLHDWSRDLSGENEEHDFWHNLFGGGDDD